MLWILAILLGCDLVNDDANPSDGCATEPIDIWLEFGGDDCLLVGSDGLLYFEDLPDGGNSFADPWSEMGPTGDGGVAFEARDVEWMIVPSADDGLCAETIAGPWDIHQGVNEDLGVGLCSEDLALPGE